MLPFFGIFRVILFGQIIFSTRFTNALPDTVTTTIVDENGVDIELKWLKTNQFLANRHLPIWRANSLLQLIPDKRDMENIGNFEMYHDLDKSSAVIYLEKENSLYGIIGTKYLLIDFPVDKLQEKITVGQTDYLIGISREFQTFDTIELIVDRLMVSPINNNEPSVSNVDHRTIPLKKRPYVNNEASTSRDDSYSLYEKRPRFNEKQFTSHTSENNWDKPSTSNVHLKSELDKFIDGNSGNKPLGPFYPEILLLVSHDVMRTQYRDLLSGYYLTGHIIYYLIYMNAVSMLFAKLARDVEININIAGIIFEETAGAFPSSTSQYVNGQLICPNQQLVLDSISNYINDVKSSTNEKLFSEDSFDFFLYITEFNYGTNDIPQLTRFNYGTNQYIENRRGITTEFFNIYDQRVSAKLSPQLLMINFQEKFRISKFLGSIINNIDIFQTYIDTTRELSHLMNINDDSVKSHSIMQKYALMLGVDCLKWSPESIQDFKTFFSQNKNRCFLLNKPRSLHEYGTPRETLPPKDQCKCYGLYPAPATEDSLRFHTNDRVCRTRLPCITSELQSVNSDELLYRPNDIPYPIDGTPCAPTRVCWLKRCIKGVMNT